MSLNDEIKDSELDKLLEERKQQNAVSNVQQQNVANNEEAPRTIETLIHNEINERYANEKDKVFKNEEISQILSNIAKKTAEVQLEDDMLAVLSKEQKNMLAKHILDCEKEKLNYRKAKEKNLVREQVKAEVFNKKVEVLKKKYGYLYDVDKDGNIKDFIPNKAYNRYKAFCKWYAGTGDGFKKITKTTLKVLLWVGIAAIIVIVGYKLIQWISGLNLPKM